MKNHAKRTQNVRCKLVNVSDDRPPAGANVRAATDADRVKVNNAVFIRLDR